MAIMTACFAVRRLHACPLNDLHERYRKRSSTMASSARLLSMMAAHKRHFIAVTSAGDPSDLCPLSSGTRQNRCIVIDHDRTKTELAVAFTA